MLQGTQLPGYAESSQECSWGGVRVQGCWGGRRRDPWIRQGAGVEQAETAGGDGLELGDGSGSSWGSGQKVGCLPALLNISLVWIVAYFSLVSVTLFFPIASSFPSLSYCLISALMLFFNSCKSSLGLLLLVNASVVSGVCPSLLFSSITNGFFYSLTLFPAYFLNKFSSVYFLGLLTSRPNLDRVLSTFNTGILRRALLLERVGRPALEDEPTEMMSNSAVGAFLDFSIYFWIYACDTRLSGPSASIFYSSKPKSYSNLDCQPPTLSQGRIQGSCCSNCWAYQHFLDAAISFSLNFYSILSTLPVINLNQFLSIILILKSASMYYLGS